MLSQAQVVHEHAHPFVKDILKTIDTEMKDCVLKYITIINQLEIEIIETENEEKKKSLQKKLKTTFQKIFRSKSLMKCLRKVGKKI